MVLCRLRPTPPSSVVAPYITVHDAGSKGCSGPKNVLHFNSTHTYTLLDSFQLVWGVHVTLTGEVESELGPGDLLMPGNGDIEEQDVLLEREVFCGGYRDSI